MNRICFSSCQRRTRKRLDGTENPNGTTKEMRRLNSPETRHTCAGECGSEKQNKIVPHLRSGLAEPDSSLHIAMSNGYSSPWYAPAMSTSELSSSKMGALRRRRGHTSNQEPSPRRQGHAAFATAMHRFDLYAKVDDDLRVKTEAGAAVTIGFWLLTLLLVWGEVTAYYRQAPATERLVVDSTMGQKLRINADIVSVHPTSWGITPPVLRFLNLPYSM